MKTRISLIPSDKGAYGVSHSDFPSPKPLDEARPENLLDSWKEIAAYLDRDVRTVQRWEKKEGLPVHRQIHEKLGTVYAYRSEIDAWWTERSAKLTTKGENDELAGVPHIVSWPVNVPEGPVKEVTAAISESKVPRWAAYAAAFAGLAVIVFGVYEITRIPHWPFLRRSPLEGMRITRLTFTGKIKDAAMSPDGKLIALVKLDSGHRTVWVYQIATGSSGQVVPGDIGYWDPDARLTFSPDDTYIYYEKLDSIPCPTCYGLYRVPMVGGTPQKLIADVDSAVTFSPDGKRFAFVRNSNERKEVALIIADSDGTKERPLAVRKRVNDFAFTSEAPAWSPDGKLIAAPIGYEGNVGLQRLEVVEADTGRETRVGTQSWWRIARMSWLPDGHALVFVARESTSALNAQIWQVDFPAGDARRVTNDLADYFCLTASADATRWTTLQEKRASSLWVLLRGDAGRATQITPGIDSVDGSSGFTWMPDQRILYTSVHAGGESMRTVTRDGHDIEEFPLGPGLHRRPSACPDGHYILYTSQNDAGRNVWRSDSAGGEARQLTFSNEDGFAQCSRDSKWFIYGSGNKGHPTLFKMPTEGGQSIPLSDKYRGVPRLSPDSKWVVAAFEDPSKHTEMAVISVDGGKLRWPFEVPENFDWNAHVAWTPDGRGIIYSVIHDGVSNLWVRPLSGGPPTPLTDFKEGSIFSFNWSPDGSQLVLARGSITDDAVLFTSHK
jgi:Tol biopolymer transport system component